MYKPNLLEKSNRNNIMFPVYIYGDFNNKNYFHKSSITAHWHPEIEILFFKSDSSIEINGVASFVQKDDIVFINSENIHSVNTKCSFIATLFSLDFLNFKNNDYTQDNILNKLKNKQLLFPVIISKSNLIYSEIKKMLTEIIQLYHGIILGRELKIKCNIYNMIFLVYTNNQFEKTKSKNISNKNLENIKLSLKYIELNYKKNITIEDLAKVVMFSKFHFIRLFKDFTGTTPTRYLINIRLENSIELMKEGKNVTQVSYEVGFNNVSYYAKKFKQLYGVTPTKYIETFEKSILDKPENKTFRRQKNMIENLQKILDECGVFQHGIIDIKQIVFLEEVRKMCEVNTCGQYGKTWACPPAIGTIDQCRERCNKYNKMILFSGKYDLEDSFDFEGMTKGMNDFKIVARNFDSKIQKYLKDYIMLSNEGCGICEKCTYPDNPCRFPDKVHGSIEGYGIFVSEIAKIAGINYINGVNTVTYFGALIYND